MDPYHSGLLLLLALAFVCLNAFFVLSEFAIVKVRRSRLEELTNNGVKNASLALNITKSLDTYLSATQLGITLASIALGWISQASIGVLLEYLFTLLFGSNSIWSTIISATLAFIIITLFHVVLGELVPKSVAIAKTESIALFVARPLHFFWLTFFPFIWFFDVLTRFFLKFIGIAPANKKELAHSDEELKIIVGESLKEGYIDSIEGEIIKNAVDFSDTCAKEIMTPRKDMVCLCAEDSYEDNIKIVLTTHHTRYPYFSDSKDNILGMLHIRDLMTNVLGEKEEEKKDLKSILRQMIVVPESAIISEVLTMMNKQQVHTALVVDEYGGTAGLLTMEDIIEEIMGDISDEHDEMIQEYRKLSENLYEVSGKLDLQTLKEQLNIVCQESEHVTIGGYVFDLLGRLPEVGDKCDDGRNEFIITHMDKTRIDKLKLRILPKEESEDS